MQSRRNTSRCPCCGTRSSSVHSYYRRQLSSLPVHGKRV
ncbi:transposase family protein, partial [uncultured Phocaeicola sp.]